MADLDETIRLNPRHAEALARRAEFHLANDDADKAIADATRALQVEPKNQTALVVRGPRCTWLRPRSATPGRRAPTSAFLRLGRTNTEAALLLARPALPKPGNPARLMDDLEPDDPASTSDNAYGVLNRGSLHCLERDFPKALADYDRALALNPGDGQTLINRAEIHAFQNDMKKAMAEFRRGPPGSGVEDRPGSTRRWARMEMRPGRPAQGSPRSPEAIAPGPDLGGAAYAYVAITSARDRTTTTRPCGTSTRHPEHDARYAPCSALRMPGWVLEKRKRVPATALADFDEIVRPFQGARARPTPRSTVGWAWIRATCPDADIYRDGQARWSNRKVGGLQADQLCRTRAICPPRWAAARCRGRRLRSRPSKPPKQGPQPRSGRTMNRPAKWSKYLLDLVSAAGALPPAGYGRELIELALRLLGRAGTRDTLDERGQLERVYEPIPTFGP